MNRSWFTRWYSVVSLCLILFATAVAADEYPSKPIRIIVPFPAGSSADMRTRQLIPLLVQRLKQQIIVDNRPGAAGSIGTRLAAKSPPDGYTITYIVTNTVAVGPHLFKDAGFNPIQDLVPLIIAMKTASILVVKNDSPIRSAQDLIALSRARPGKLTYGTSGPGSPQHLMGERFKKMAGIEIVPVSYKGDAPTLTDLMGGQIDMTFSPPPAALPLIDGGKLRALAVTSSKRLARLPDTPTIAESGVPGYDEMPWNGYAVPAGTPSIVVKKLHAAFHSAMLTSAYQHFIEQNGAELVAGTQDNAEQLMKSDYERYRKIVRELDLKVE